MLILNASEKGDGVTGKFGLGFKSVWLVSESPRIVSGRLQMEIVATLLPRSLGDATALRQRLREQQPKLDRQWVGTLMELPLLTGISVEEVVGRFKQLCGVMVALARQVQRVDLIQEGKRAQIYPWQGQPLLHWEGVTRGEVRVDRQAWSVIRFDLGEGVLLLKLGARGWETFEGSLPSLWVTAPLEESERLGFVLHAMFAVDAGRSRLAHNHEANRTLAQKLGAALSRLLELMRCQSEQEWPPLRQALQLAPDITPYLFWQSLWQVLFHGLWTMKRQSGLFELAAAFLHEALVPLLANGATLPNPLSASLLRPKVIRWIAEGALVQPESVTSLAQCRCWPIAFAPEQIIPEEVKQWLQILQQHRNDWQPLSLNRLFEAVAKGQQPLEEADLALFASLRGDQEESSPSIQEDWKQAHAWAQQWYFYTEQPNESRRCEELLTDRSPLREEQLLTAFAPPHHGLSSRYSEPSVAFFLWIRGEGVIDPQRNWIGDAEPLQRQGALRYLLEGRHGAALSRYWARHLAGSWLAEVTPESPILVDWPLEERQELCYQRLKAAEEIQHLIEISRLPSLELNWVENEPIPPAKALKAVAAWWDEVRAERLPEYLHSLYPEAQPLQLEFDEYGGFNRSDWLQLFVLGGLHTVGLRQEQHRSFIQYCQAQGWWSIFTQENVTDHFEDWMGVLEAFLDDQIESQRYEHWMKNFTTIYKLARYLESYVELFHGFNRYPKAFLLERVLAPRADLTQQGGGINAPPIERTLGKTGTHLVVRECYRLGILTRPHLREHCFVPYKGVVNLLQAMGCTDLDHDSWRQSKTIWHFIRRYLGENQATFSQDFDIPFRYIAQDSALQQQLLGRTLSISN